MTDTPADLPSAVTEIDGSRLRSRRVRRSRTCEDYFPTRLVTDIWFGDHGDAVHRQGIKAHPAILLLAGDGILDPPAPEAGVEVVVAPRISTALAGFAGR